MQLGDIIKCLDKLIEKYKTECYLVNSYIMPVWVDGSIDFGKHKPGLKRPHLCMFPVAVVSTTKARDYLRDVLIRFNYDNVLLPHDMGIPSISLLRDKKRITEETVIHRSKGGYELEEGEDYINLYQDIQHISDNDITQTFFKDKLSFERFYNSGDLDDILQLARFAHDGDYQGDKAELEFLVPKVFFNNLSLRDQMLYMQELMVYKHQLANLL